MDALIVIGLIIGSGGLGGLLSPIITSWLQRPSRRLDEARARKIEVSADADAAAEWNRLYREVQEQYATVMQTVDRLQVENNQLKVRIALLEQQDRVASGTLGLRAVQVWVDAEHNVLHISPNGARVFGWDPIHVSGRPVTALIDIRQEVLRSALLGGTPAALLGRVQRPDGRGPVDVTIGLHPVEAGVLRATITPVENPTDPPTPRIH